MFIEIVDRFNLLKSTRKKIYNWKTVILHFMLRIPIGKVVFKGFPNTLFFEKCTAAPFFLASLIDNGWSILKTNENEVLLGLDESVKFNLLIDKKEGWHGLYEVFIKKVYGTDFRDKRILDIGMNIADSSIYFAVNGAKKIVGVEPIPTAYERAILNISKSKMESVIFPVNRAVTCKGSDQIELILSESASAVSTVDIRYNNISQYATNKIKVKTITLEYLIEQYFSDGIDVLKIDCEGCEYDIFLNEDDDIISKPESIIMEFHNYPDLIENKLKSLGYSVSLSSRKKTGLLFASKNIV